MSQFEFIAVFVSIIFGLSLTQVLSGAVHLLQRRRLERSHFGWTLFVLYVLVINWWTFFPWAKNTSWEFEEFFVVLVWALTHYVMAAALYPTRDLDEYIFSDHRTSILWAFLIAAALDVVQTGARGDLLNPWYYPLFVIYMMTATATGLLTSRDAIHQVIPWVLIGSMVIWSIVVRRFLT